LNPPAPRTRGSLIDHLEPAGRSSAPIREIRRLSREPSARRLEGLMVAEGIHLAQEALEHPGRIRVAVASPRLMRSEEGAALLARLREIPVPARRVDDALLASLGDVESHQGILLVIERPRWDVRDLLPDSGPPLVLAACGVQDPGNLGALARIAEAAWATGLVCAGAGADPYSPRALRASAGSLLRLPLAEFPDAALAAAKLRAAGLRLVGASPRARTGYREEPLTGALAIFVGSEGAGLSVTAEESLDALVRIPMREGVDSLNLAAAAAVILFEAAGRRSPG
jgi:RNA methyltransferase, TrmH family